MVSPDVLTNPAVALNPASSRASLIQGQRDVVLAGHIAGQGHIGLVVRPERGRSGGVSEFNLDGGILVGGRGRAGAPSHCPRTFHLVDYPTVADHEVRIGLTAVGRALHIAGRLLPIGPTTDVMEDDIFRGGRLVGPLLRAELVLVANLVGQDLFAVPLETVGNPVDLPDPGYLMAALDKGPVTTIVVPTVVEKEVALEGRRRDLVDSPTWDHQDCQQDNCQCRCHAGPDQT